ALIVQADTIVFVLSPDAVASPECQKEVDFAASLNKRFAPVVCRSVADGAVPDPLARIHRIDFVDVPFDERADRLVKALHTNIDWIRRHTEFGDQARRWQAAGRPGGLLLRSPALEQAEHWIASRPQDAPPPTEVTQVFVERSRRAATTRRNVLTGGLGAGFAAMTGAAGFALWQREVARQNE